MKEDKAYKLLAIQEGISNNEAKELIDTGLVSARGQKISLARAMMSAATKFSVVKMPSPKVIFEDENLMAIDKPALLTSEKISQIYKIPLLHRLDKDTSGVLLLVKNDKFGKKAIEEFRNLRVKKEYLAVVRGILSEEICINEPIITLKTNGGAISKISPNGKEAISNIIPIMVSGKKSLVKVEIKTGRTHQIRVHLNFATYPIVGDKKYGKNRADRMYLHAYKIELLDYKFKSNLPNDFNKLGFEISRNFDI